MFTECSLKPNNLGWLLLFPIDPNAGLVFFNRTELDDFIASCVLTPTADFDTDRITHCPQYWLDRARIYQPTF